MYKKDMQLQAENRCFQTYVQELFGARQRIIIHYYYVTPRESNIASFTVSEPFLGDSIKSVVNKSISFQMYANLLTCNTRNVSSSRGKHKVHDISMGF